MTATEHPTRALPESAPPLPAPRGYRPNIALIGCGNITESHLQGYRDAGWEVGLLCDLNEARARQRQERFYPAARVTADVREVFADPSVDVVDVALHAEQRAPVIEAALRARKHVLSQKPFVLDLPTGQKLAALAEANGRLLAVNQNGRWAPYVRYLHQLCASGALGEVQTVQVHINWDHTWIRGMDFEKIHHIVLFDFGIHWFDMTRLFFGKQSAQEVFATVRHSAASTVHPPLLACSSVAFPSGCASLTFDGNSGGEPRESITITGSRGVVRAYGPLHAAHTVEIMTDQGRVRPLLDGQWYPDGFRGAMGELLSAIEEHRTPSNSARDQVETLELVFAAVESADRACAVAPGQTRAVGDSCRIQQAVAPSG